MGLSRAKEIQINDNLNNEERAVLCLAEFLGTLMLVFIGCMSCTPMSANSHLHVALTFGLAIMIAVQSVGHISGSHVNPAVTIAAVVLGHTPVILFPLYVISQILGATAGFALLKIFSPVAISCSPSLGKGVSVWQAVGVEFELTFMLVFVCAAVWDRRNTDKHDSLALRLGLAVAALAMAGIPYTGAHMNPARTFGPVLLNWEWDILWVYCLGPMMGGLVAGLCYRFLFSKEQGDRDQTPLETIGLNAKA